MSKQDRDPRLERISVPPNVAVGEAMQRIDQGGLGIVLVVDQEGRLVGTVTDGDIRRALLRGVALAVPVTEVMNTSFAAASPDTPAQEVLGLMRRRSLRHIPVVDDDGRVCRLALLSDYAEEASPNVTAVIFAGGFGERLRPLTEDRPKPMLEVGGVPVLELIIRQLALSGVRDCIITTHYRAEMIQDRLGDGAGLGVDIRYLREDTQQGTAGSLRIVRDMVSGPVIVSMGDILTNLNFANMLQFHRETRAELTVGVCRYRVRVPFGVVNVAAGHVLSLDEKPDVEFLINAGLYVVERSGLELVPDQGQYFMTDLINDLLARQRHVVSFPIEERWVDIGRAEDLQRAMEESDIWGHHFPNSDETEGVQ